MKYVVMIFRSIDRVWTAEDDQSLARLIQLERELAASGELVSSEGLRPPEDGRIVQIRDGQQVVTDGPFGEAKEQLAGFFLIDAADDDRAQAIAGSVSAAVSDRVELRGTLISSGMPAELR
ncbi:YciI family protein [Kribbella sp. NPDC004875]|uniref:YciI family protein n=1 Tax=Kribbella sp. NPDC004875 TaxID=3364107 RepID=UPI0036885CCA